MTRQGDQEKLDCCLRLLRKLVVDVTDLKQRSVSNNGNSRVNSAISEEVDTYLKLNTRDAVIAFEEKLATSTAFENEFHTVPYSKLCTRYEQGNVPGASRRPGPARAGGRSGRRRGRRREAGEELIRWRLPLVNYHLGDCKTTTELRATRGARGRPGLTVHVCRDHNRACVWHCGITTNKQVFMEYGGGRVGRATATGGAYSFHVGLAGGRQHSVSRSAGAVLEHRADP
ncbi:hypothetical protein EVAR_94259_1 [Eumeta japonica]|uniref:Uncharacterized protein n=1 Tax=Eumeta variegata TaxID=151549 RepID=A0A4C1UEU3_EUMVA|nr:hypothetical protein EVAR_94259_1 [Eumeta japonica]